jgi:hypothetical protein
LFYIFLVVLLLLLSVFVFFSVYTDDVTKIVSVTRLREMGRRFAWLPTLLLLRFSAFADDRCPMNVSQPAPENAYQVNDVLWAGQPEKPYPPAAYRSVQGVGYVLCTCETGSCIRKCCAPNAAYVNSRCTPLNVSDHVAEFKVGAPQPVKILIIIFRETTK